MQKYLQEYLDELSRRQKKTRKTRIAIVILVIFVVAGIAGILSQYGVAMTGTAKCGLEEHQHVENCYKDVLVCGLEEGESHTHTEECQYPSELTCGLEESEGHIHTEECQYPPELTCGLEESEEHTHTEACYTAPEGYACGLEETEGHAHTEECYTKELVCGKEEHIHTDACYIDVAADVEEQAVWDNQYAAMDWKGTWGEDLAAAAQMQIGYPESINNYTVTENGSHKGYTRYGQFAGDVYCDWDAAFVNFCMYYAGLKESGLFPEVTDTAKWQEEFIKIREANASCLATPEAYGPAVGDLVFFQKENEETTDQMGIVSSVNTENRTIKVIEGNNGNEVRETEYSLDDMQNHIVGYLNITALESAYKNEPAETEASAEPETPAETNDAEAVVTPDNTEPAEPTIELTTEVDDTVITLSGPESSFETTEGLSIQAEKITKEKEMLEAIEEAVEKVAEEKEKEVDEYQAFDIKLLAGGEEVQPVGPVEVKFSGRDVKKAVKDEKTEVNVLHVDEETGEATDMEATATEKNEVVIETEHFSVYVYVKLNLLFGKTNFTVQHWAYGFQTIDSDSIINAIDGDNTSIFEDAGTYSTITGKEEPDKKVRQKSEKKEIYSTDEISFPNEYYTTDIRNLSKLYKSGSLNYTLKKIWITTDWNNATRKNGFDADDGWRDYVECWLDGQNQPDKYYSKQGTGENIADNGTPGADVKLEINDDTIKIGNKVLPVVNKDNPVLVRFWYEPTVPETTHQFDTPTIFYDYDISEKVDGNKVYSDEKGINSPINYDNTSTNNRLGVGQYSSGNISAWSQNAQYNGLFLNKGNATIVQNIVQDTLDSNGQLQFNVNAPRNLFGSPEGEVSKGATAYTNYNLQFLRNGDTYTLESVYNETTGQMVKSASGLSKFMYFGEKWGGKGPLYSNNFWPMDEVKNADPLMGKTNGQYDFYKDNASQKETSSPIADDKSEHNCYFGMTYEIKFTVGDYTGPMEYYFRGDDDFWLFIDGQRVIDIGGIHAAVGQSIDLRAWMEQRGMLAEDKLQQEHTLKVFYMERGASGSCCYMQFTIPDATPVPTPTVETKDYEVEKKWDDNGNPFRPGSIVVQLQQISDVDGTSTITPTSEMVELSAEKGWKHKWTGLPSINGSTQGEYKYTYSVKEINLPPGYHSEVDENGVLTNTLEPVKVKVKKEWENDTDLKTYRPDSVTLRLYANGEPYTDDKEKSEENPEGYRDITLNEAGGWEGIIENLPEYYYELVSDGTDSSDASGREYNAIPIQYSVREVVNGTVVEEGGTADGKDNSGYVVNYTETEGDNSFAATVTATNTLQTSFQIMKKGKVGDEILNPVKGAEFVLTQCDQNGTVSEGAQSYTGRSDENGVVSWKSEEIPKGTYLLEETKSPEGYALSEEKWIITVKDYGRVEIRTGSGEVVDPDSKLENSDGTLVFTYTFCNEVVYKLPSTGGSGIYWYMFGGVLFMAAASLIAYKNKHREVFGK